MFSFHDIDTVLESAKEVGLDKIRCNLTGRLIGRVEDDALLAAIQYEYFNDPYASIESIIDNMLLRTLVVNSRPAPHLVSHRDKDGMQFLRSFFPADAFALLSTRMLFDNKINRQFEDSSSIREIRMQWLIECQEFLIENQDLPGFMSHVDALIRLDAIHDVRTVFYSDAIKIRARMMIEESFDYDVLVAFLHDAEDAAFEAMSNKKIRPVGNPMSLSAALMAMTPEQIETFEQEERALDNKRRKAIAKIQAVAHSSTGGKVTKRRIRLEDVNLPKELAEKYAAEGKLNLKEHRAKHKADAAGKPKSRRNKSANRFGNLTDIDFTL